MKQKFLVAPLSQEIRKEYDKLINLVASLPSSFHMLKQLESTEGKVSVRDMLAYQIGWGKCLVTWYECGIKGEMPLMPGEGFSTWDYVGIAHHFYVKYQCKNIVEQQQSFDQVVSQILTIVEAEFQTDNLDKMGVWAWCTLRSGKQWPLSKWIRVNTCAPYKRAYSLIKKNFK